MFNMDLTVESQLRKLPTERLWSTDTLYYPVHGAQVGPGREDGASGSELDYVGDIYR